MGKGRGFGKGEGKGGDKKASKRGEGEAREEGKSKVNSEGPVMSVRWIYINIIGRVYSLTFHSIRGKLSLSIDECIVILIVRTFHRYCHL